MVAKRSLLFIILQLSFGAIIIFSFSLTSADIPTLLISLSFYLFIFIIPIFFFIRFCLNQKPLIYLKLSTDIKKGLIYGIGISLILITAFLLKNLNQPVKNINIYFLIGRFLAGPLEETIFRGFYLNTFSKSLKFSHANIITSAIFALLHFNQLSQQGLIILLFMFIFSLWLGYFYRQSNSLIAPILIHSTYNIMTVLF